MTGNWGNYGGEYGVMPERGYRGRKGGLSKTLKKIVAFTCTDFGQEGRREVLSTHFTLKAAKNQYGRLWEIYGRLHKYKVWLEEVKK